MDTKKKKTGQQDSERKKTPFQGVLYKKFFRLRALAHQNVALEQPVNRLWRFKPRAGMNQYRETRLR
jgi:hypothetical protein